MKPLLHRLSVRQLIILGIAAPTLLLVLVGWLQWQSVRDYRDAQESAVHAHTVLLDLESFLATMNAAETGQRGYLLAQKEKYLEPYNYALTHSRDQLQTLRLLTEDNPELQKDLDRLEPLVGTKLSELAQTVALERQAAHKDAMDIVKTDLGEDTMEQIRGIISNMHDAEWSLLTQREAAYQRTAQINSELSGLLIALGFAFIGSVVLLLRRMERMQAMIKICAWSKLIEYEGQWLTVEEYLTRRFKARITHGMSNAEAQKMIKLIQQEKGESR